MDNKGRTAVITLDTAAAFSGDYSDLSAGHSGPCLGGGVSLSLEPLRVEGCRARLGCELQR